MFSLITKLFETDTKEVLVKEKEIEPLFKDGIQVWPKEETQLYNEVQPETIKSVSIDVHIDPKLLIQEIHNAFDNAEDELLCTAKKILQELQVDDVAKMIEKAKLLKEIGFTGNPAVEKASVLIKKEAVMKQAADMITYYKQEYPFQKFLSTEQLDNICKKYNLIYAPIKHYTEDVPKKNLLEIKNAKQLKREDICDRSSFIKVSASNFSNECPSHIKQKLINGVEIDFIENRTTFGWGSLSTILRHNYDSSIGSNYFTYEQKDWQIKTIIRTGLFIAAPKNHFNLTGLSKEGLGFFDVEIINMDDPIVFRYVKGGVQVLSKWGLEASDPELVNPIEN